MTSFGKILFASILSVFCLSTLWYVWMEAPDSSENTGTPPSHQLISGKTPDDFFRPFPKKEEKLLPPPPAPEPKVIVKLIKPQDLFENPIKNTPPLPDPKEIERNAILSQTLFSQKFSQEVVDLEKRPDSEMEYTLPDLNKDADFSEHGIGKSTATYPVELSRVLTMNKHIPVVLYTEVKSEIPTDKVIAVVEQNVTGYHGRKILIPRGSQAIGKFGALKSPDSERMGIVWYRILTPEGINISLSSEAVDQEGASGLTGFIDKRWKDKYGTALLFSSISAIAQLSVPVDNENVKAAADSFSSELGPIVAEQLRQSLNITQRINIPKGSRFNISPLVDIWFKESENHITTFPMLSDIFGRINP